MTYENQECDQCANKQYTFVCEFCDAKLCDDCSYQQRDDQDEGEAYTLCYSCDYFNSHDLQIDPPEYELSEDEDSDSESDENDE
jgi:hypothetical protein